MRLILCVAALSLVPHLHAQSAPAPPPPSQPPKAQWKTAHILQDVPPLEVRRAGLAVRAILNTARRERRIRAEGTPVFQAAQEAVARGDINLAWRLLVRVLALYEGLPADETIDAAASLAFKLDRRILVPGAALHPRLEPLFLLDGALPAKLTARVWLEDLSGKPAGLTREENFDQIREFIFSLPTAQLAPGKYFVRYALMDEGGKLLASARRAVWVDAALRTRALDLGAAVESLARSDAGKKSAAHALAYDAVAIFADVYDRAITLGIGLLPDEVHPAAERLLAADPWSLGTERLDPDADIAVAEKLVAGLRLDGNPFAGMSGNIRLASRAATWRVFIPPNYNRGKKWPIVLAFHTEESDEGFLMEMLAPLAAERNCFVLAPASYSAGDWPEGDVKLAFQLLSSLREVFSLEDRVMVLGAGQGTAAAFRLAWSEPGSVSCLAAAGGALRPLPDFDKAPPIPVLYRYGEFDSVFTEDEGRPFAAAVNYRLPLGEGQMLKGLGRMETLREAAKVSFAFFDSVRAGRWKPVRPGAPVSGPKR